MRYIRDSIVLFALNLFHLPSEWQILSERNSEHITSQTFTRIETINNGPHINNKKKKIRRQFAGSRLLFCGENTAIQCCCVCWTRTSKKWRVSASEILNLIRNRLPFGSVGDTVLQFVVLLGFENINKPWPHRRTYNDVARASHTCSSMLRLARKKTLHTGTIWLYFFFFD